MTRPFALDRSNAKLTGVCAGIARSADLDVTIVRIATALSLFVLGPIAILLYLVAGWIMPDA
ncbi:PspC domain-containing protein [Allosphingosinicella sp.]|jgi:phage shock protein C|uniref:PspC domain-containing protein n=1 Tax=Allosphingosinicella sp. TaxID=2823234 RepID=UPI002EE9B8D0